MNKYEKEAMTYINKNLIKLDKYMREENLYQFDGVVGEFAIFTNEWLNQQLEIVSQITDMTSKQKKDWLATLSLVRKINYKNIDWKIVE